MMSFRQLGRIVTKEFNPFIVKNGRAMCSAGPLVNVKVNDKTGVALVTMQRAPVNGLNLELIKALSTALDDLSNNRSRGMILTSSLPTIFSGGLDIMEMYKPNEDRIKDFWSSLQDLWMKLFGSGFPTAAAVNGHSPAGGCLLAMCCEYRVMVEGKFTIGLNETALGIVAPSWFQNTMKNTISSRIAEKALTLGTLFPVDEALKIGLIDEVAKDKAEAITKCESFISKFDKINPQARMLTKFVFREKILKELEETRDEDLQRFLLAVCNPKVQKSLELYIQALKSKSK
ncbi:enoyl-CoA delta isomerase 1, mitochondrial-like [Arctopsyche grandis]|uniref:enoyl-CoA delta isomerase 1, mitochondrial-like n=1 Tax=Arctopsyche grandis TaxID=121162 RepID=UPI00406D82AB